MARANGIACDFCDKPLTDRPVMGKSGWNYVWSWQEFGAASFGYTKCAECCDKAHTYMERCCACVARARRHGRSWGKQVDRFIVDFIENSVDSGALVMTHASPKATAAEGVA